MSLKALVIVIPKREWAIPFFIRTAPPLWMVLSFGKKIHEFTYG